MLFLLLLLLWRKKERQTCLSYEGNNRVFSTEVKSEKIKVQKVKVRLIVKGFEFGQCFPCSQWVTCLTDLSSSVLLWCVPASIILMVLFLGIFFFLTIHCTWSIFPTFVTSNSSLYSWIPNLFLWPRSFLKSYIKLHYLFFFITSPLECSRGNSNPIG